MLRRFYLFGIGIILGVFMLSFGPENRLKKTFYSYIDYFNINKRIIYHLENADKVTFSIKSQCQLVYYQLEKEEVLSVLDGGDVNFKLSDTKSNPKKTYTIENKLNDKKISVRFSIDNNKEVELESFWFSGDQEECSN
ncbi:MAG: hypothetical protein CMP69_05955 [Flavobacteriales bacterium]|nr:hypothetical protein [Flavobacteriales bacterium]MBH70751.1 hypothetical protein [Flavobacteriales bacterium]MBO97609.1 hypothetical protein [Flavobacteriales bacterium]|tara:strand:- start:403 stop:816 length:414 start_codon:yes stop_codon:yes gene_type:complete